MWYKICNKIASIYKINTSKSNRENFITKEMYDEIKNNPNLIYELYNTNNPIEVNKNVNSCNKENIIKFTQWKDNNFIMYRDKTYYAKTSSPYFDIIKYVGKEKPTKYYKLEELVELFENE